MDRKLARNWCEGAQTRFAEEIGVDRRRLNNVLVHYPLSQKLAQKIVDHYPGVSSDFLFRGKFGGHLDRQLQRRCWLRKEDRDFGLYFLVHPKRIRLSPQAAAQSMGLGVPVALDLKGAATRLPP